MRKASPRCAASLTELTRGSSTRPLFTMDQPSAPWSPPSAKMPASFHASAGGSARRHRKYTNGNRKTAPTIRPSSRWKYSHQKIALKPSSVMSWLLRRNSGVRRYFANVSSHCAASSGGTAPTSGCHSTIESPECVRRVIPPTTTIANTSAQQASNHTETARCGSLEESAGIEVGIVPDLDGGPHQGWGGSTSGSPAVTRFRLVDLIEGEIPVEQVLDDSFHELGAAVLVIEIVRMLPDVDREERRGAHRDRRAGVRRGDDFELPVTLDEPRPAAAEALDRGIRELLVEFAGAAEILLEPARDRLGRLAGFRLQAIPEEGMVPRLRGVVEDLAVFLAAHGGGDHVLERKLGEPRAGDQLVQLFDVGAVVLPVVQRDRARGDVRRERAFVPG